MVDILITGFSIAWLLVLAAIVSKTAVSFLEEDAAKQTAVLGSNSEDPAPQRGSANEGGDENNTKADHCGGCGFHQPTKQDGDARGCEGKVEVELSNRTNSASNNNIDVVSAPNMVRQLYLVMPCTYYFGILKHEACCHAQESAKSATIARGNQDYSLTVCVFFKTKNRRTNHAVLSEG